MDAKKIVARALELVPASELVVASSFGLEDVVLIDLFAKTKQAVRYITLDTGRLHDETYQTIDRVRERYGIDVEVYFPQSQLVEELVSTKGPFSFRNSIEERKYCCKIRKLEPLARALKGATGWACGLRREQSPTRSDISAIEKDESNGNIWKFNPLLEWTLKDVWQYVQEQKLPYNPLHDLGYPSIGCSPCTRPIQDGEDQRSGRWWWEDPEHKECGLHQASSKRKS